MYIVISDKIGLVIWCYILAFFCSVMVCFVTGGAHRRILFCSSSAKTIYITPSRCRANRTHDPPCQTLQNLMMMCNNFRLYTSSLQDMERNKSSYFSLFSLFTLYSNKITTYSSINSQWGEVWSNSGMRRSKWGHPMWMNKLTGGLTKIRGWLAPRKAVEL